MNALMMKGYLQTDNEKQKNMFGVNFKIPTSAAPAKPASRKSRKG
jgi:hypothetical protein